MKQLPLLSIPTPTLREFIREQLRDFRVRQEGRAEKRRRQRARRKMPRVENVQEELFMEDGKRPATYKKALDAMDNLFSDTSVSREKTRDLLLALRDEIDWKLQGLPPCE